LPGVSHRGEQLRTAFCIDASTLADGGDANGRVEADALGDG